VKAAARRLPLRAWLLSAVGVGAALIALIAHETGALDGFERETIDARFEIRGGKEPDNEIAIVGLDQQSLTAFNERPPISRIHYARLLDRLRAADPRLIAIDVQFIGQEKPREDQALLDAVARNGPVLLATRDNADGPAPVPAGETDAEGAVPASGGVDSDSDNVVRQMMYAPVSLETFAVRGAELVTGEPVSEAEFPGNHAWIDFHGPPGTYPTHSFVDVLNEEVSADSFRDKLVLVGVTDPVTKDVFVTAASSTPMPGVELHANALETILDGFPLQPLGGGLEIALLFALAATPALLGLRLPALYMLAASVGALLIFLVGAQLAFDSGRIVPVAAPILALTLSAAGAAGVDFLVERRTREALQETLSRLPGDTECDYFISYRRDQASWPARMLRGELAARFGEDSVFMDVDSLEAGQEWPRRIEEAIRGSAVVLVLIGPGWTDARTPDGGRRLDDPGDWVRLEIEAALRAQVVVVPVLVEGARMPTEAELPATIRALLDRNAFWLTPERWNTQVDELVGSIRDGRIRDFFSRERSRRAAEPEDE
jgi:CHASE2 domain-containing sensor protein